jgi:hypothetical protein
MLKLPDVCGNGIKIVSSILLAPTHFDNPSPQDLDSTPYLQNTRNSATCPGRKKASADEGGTALASPLSKK